MRYYLTENNGTITVTVRAESDSAIGDMQFTVHPDESFDSIGLTYEKLLNAAKTTGYIDIQKSRD
jgi:hypothetical protein